MFKWKKFKKTTFLAILAFQGLAFQSFGAEKYTLWKSEPIADAQYMREITPDLQSLSTHWRVQLLPEFEGNTYEIIGFPGEERTNKTRREYTDYRPAFPQEYTIDSVIFTRFDICDFLDNFWTPNGFSSHFIISQEGKAFMHANPLNDEKGQMAGKWNNRSLEVVFIDTGDQKLSSIQQTVVKDLITILEERSNKIKIRYGGSIYDTKQLEGIPGYESGEVKNISEVLEFLSLSPLTL